MSFDGLVSGPESSIAAILKLLAVFWVGVLQLI
jgi:hypothetical protein